MFRDSALRFERREEGWRISRCGARECSRNLFGSHRRVSMHKPLKMPPGSGVRALVPSTPNMVQAHWANKSRRQRKNQSNLPNHRRRKDELGTALRLLPPPHLATSATAQISPLSLPAHPHTAKHHTHNKRIRTMMTTRKTKMRVMKTTTMVRAHLRAHLYFLCSLTNSFLSLVRSLLLSTTFHSLLHVDTRQTYTQTHSGAYVHMCRCR
jgi:hypothetical protein